MKHSYAYILYCANISARYVWNFIIYLNGLICQYFFSVDVLLFVIFLSVYDFLFWGAVASWVLSRAELVPLVLPLTTPDLLYNCCHRGDS